MDMAVLVTPADAAQPVTDRLVALGVKAILNFAPVQLVGAGRRGGQDGQPRARAGDAQLRAGESVARVSDRRRTADSSARAHRSASILQVSVRSLRSVHASSRATGAVLCLLASAPGALARAGRRLRPRHPQRPHHRRHRLAVVRRRRRHPGRPDRRDRHGCDGAAARQTIDAAGMVVAPGFIDMLGQSELTHPGRIRSLPSKIFQGITTEITGEGGSRRRRSTTRSSRPTAPATTTTEDHARLADARRVLRAAREAGHRDQPGELRRRDAGAPHGAGRRRPARRPPAELERMKALVREAMREGAVGRLDLAAVSAGALRQDRGADRARGRGRAVRRRLRHPHALRGRPRSTRRSTRRSGSAARRRSRSRSGTSRWRASATGAGCREVVAKIDSARRAGVDIAADTYAYPAWFNSMSAFVPPWAHDGGTAKLIERLQDPGRAPRGSARRC